MASGAISGIGNVIKRGDGASVESFTTIAEVNGIVGWSKSRDTYEVTTLDSPNGYKEFISGFRDPGGFTLNMNFTPATYNDMNDDFENDNSVNYRIVLANVAATQYDFAAMVTELSFESTTGDRITSNVTFKITGPVTTTS